jgi:hypothetical protein
LLFFVVTPGILFTLALAIGFITGICVTSLIHYLIHKMNDNEIK